MYRSPFAAFQPAHKILSPGADTATAITTNPLPHSRSRNRSSGDLSVDCSDWANPQFAQSTASSSLSPSSITHSHSSFSENPFPQQTRASWEGLSPQSIPLLPVGNCTGRDEHSHRRHNLLSRTPYPYSPNTTSPISHCSRPDDTNGLHSWFRSGKLGWWMYNTQRGWISLVCFLMFLYGTSSFILLIMNTFLWRTGVYKYPYPITGTAYELIVTHFFLFLFCSFSRSFAPHLCSLGLACLVAPNSVIYKGKDCTLSSVCGDFSRGGIFGFDPNLAKKCLPLAVVFSCKILLSNISFAYALPAMYQLYRVLCLPLAILFTYFLSPNNPPLSVTTLSSSITLTGALTVMSLQKPFLVTWESIVSGIISSFFVALYPFLLLRTFKSILLCSYRDNLNPTDDSSDLLIRPTTTTAMRHHFYIDSQDESRSFWKLLHYTNLISILLILPFTLISGEISHMYRNCYILDVPFLWLMVLGCGAAASFAFVTGFMLTKTTTPLTMILSGYPRDAFRLAILSPKGAREHVWVGFATCCGACLWYALGRRKEMGVNFFLDQEDCGDEGQRGEQDSEPEGGRGGNESFKREDEDDLIEGGVWSG